VIAFAVLLQVECCTSSNFYGAFICRLLLNHRTHCRTRRSTQSGHRREVPSKVAARFLLAD